MQVRDDTPKEIQRNVEHVVPIYSAHNGVILDMLSSIQFVTFGIFGGFGRSESENQTDSRNASDTLIRTLGDNVRIVSFSGDIAYGSIGTETHISYTVLLPKFDRCFATLLNTEFGQISELGSLS